MNRLIIVFLIGVIILGGCSKVDRNNKNENKGELKSSSSVMQDSIDTEIDSVVSEVNIGIGNDIIITEESVEEEPQQYTIPTYDVLNSEEEKAFSEFFKGNCCVYTRKGNEKWVQDYYWNERDCNGNKIGILADVDNDGVKEQVIDGLKGGFYLDYKLGKLYCMPNFEVIGSLSYFEKDGESWILIKDTTSSGRLCWKIIKMHGQEIEIEINLDSFEEEDNTWHYYCNDEEISKEKFEDERFKYLGY